MNIDIDKYLSEEEKKSIVIQEYRSLVRSKMNNENDLKRILSNTGYEIFYQIVDDLFDSDSKSIVKNTINEIIKDLSAFNIFKKPDAWDRETNGAYDILVECVRNRKDEIQKKVNEVLDDKKTITLYKSEFKKIMKEVIKEKLAKL